MSGGRRVLAAAVELVRERALLVPRPGLVRLVRPRARQPVPARVRAPLVPAVLAHHHRGRIVPSAATTAPLSRAACARSSTPCAQPPQARLSLCADHGVPPRVRGSRSMLIAGPFYSKDWALLATVTAALGPAARTTHPTAPGRTARRSRPDGHSHLDQPRDQDIPEVDSEVRAEPGSMPDPGTPRAGGSRPRPRRCAARSRARAMSSSVLTAQTHVVRAPPRRAARARRSSAGPHVAATSARRRAAGSAVSIRRRPA